jgi:hypothetical protein
MRSASPANLVEDTGTCANATVSFWAILGLIVDGRSSTRCCLSRREKRTFAYFAERPQAVVRISRTLPLVEEHFGCCFGQKNCQASVAKAWQL